MAAAFRPHPWSAQNHHQPTRCQLRRQTFASAPELHLREPVARAAPASPPLPRPLREPVQARGAQFSMPPPPPLPAPLWSRGDDHSVSNQLSLSQTLAAPTRRQQRGHPRAKEYLGQIMQEWRSQCRGSRTTSRWRRQDTSVRSLSPERLVSPRSSRASFRTAIVVDELDEGAEEREDEPADELENTQLPLVSSPEVSSIRASPACDNFAGHFADPGLTSETLREEASGWDELRRQLSQQRSKMETAIRSLPSAVPHSSGRLHDDSVLSALSQGEEPAAMVGETVPEAISDLHMAVQDGRDEQVKFSSRILEQLDDLRTRCDTTAASIGIVRSEMLERHGQMTSEAKQLRSKFELAIGSTEEASVRCLAQVAALESAFLEARASWQQEARSLRGIQARQKALETQDFPKLQDLQRQIESMTSSCREQLETAVQALRDDLQSLQESNLGRDQQLRRLERVAEELGHRQSLTSDVSDVSSCIVELRDRIEVHEQHLASLGPMAKALEQLRDQQQNHCDQQQQQQQQCQTQSHQSHRQQENTHDQSLQQHPSELGVEALAARIRELEDSTKVLLCSLQHQALPNDDVETLEGLSRRIDDHQEGLKTLAATTQENNEGQRLVFQSFMSSFENRVSAFENSVQEVQSCMVPQTRLDSLEREVEELRTELESHQHELPARVSVLEASEEDDRFHQFQLALEELKRRFDDHQELAGLVDTPREKWQDLFETAVSIEKRVSESERAIEEAKSCMASRQRVEVVEGTMQDLHTDLEKQRQDLLGLTRASQATRHSLSRLELLVKQDLISSEACNSIVDVMGSILTSSEHDLVEALSAGTSGLQLLDEHQRQSVDELDSVLGRKLEPCSREAAQPPSVESQDRASLDELTRRLSTLGGVIVSHGEALARLEDSQHQLELRHQQQQQQLDDTIQQAPIVASLEDLAGLDCTSDVSNLRHRLDDLAKDCDQHWVDIDKKLLDLEVRVSGGSTIARTARSEANSVAESKRLQAKLSAMLALDTMEAASEKLLSAMGGSCSATGHSDQQPSSCGATRDCTA